MASAYVPGLQGVVAARTRLSMVDGKNGVLVIAGYPLEEIAERATFEELVYLLWNDRLPTASELATFRAQLASLRGIPPITREVLEAAARQKAPAMDALRMAAGTLSLRTDGETLPAGPYRDALVPGARLATMAGARRAPHGLRPPHLQGARPPRGRALARGGAPLRSGRRRAAVRPRARDRAPRAPPARRAQARPESADERGVLHGARAPRTPDPG